VDSGKEKAVDSGVEYRDLVSSGVLEESLARDLRIGARVNDWQEIRGERRRRQQAS
jgi:hypothetical protein